MSQRHKTCAFKGKIQFFSRLLRSLAVISNSIARGNTFGPNGFLLSTGTGFR
jgi:hypothetical protein